MKVPYDAVARVGKLIVQGQNPVGQVVGDRYEVVKPIGQGGMGEVFYARDRRLDRPVAMKVLGQGLVSSKWAARFEAEAQMTSRIDHPGIVPIHDLGVLPDGRLYYVMKHVEGETLLARIKRKEGRDSLATLLARACEIVHRAHQEGVVHCDLKPANLMIDGHGQVYVLDWGIARVLNEMNRDSAPTAPAAPRVSTILGTVEYMAPEQEDRAFARIGPLSDVYALGAILYEILTGRPPARDAVPPRQLDPGVPAALEAACLKALEKDPARRQSSAAELAAELFRSASGRPARSARRWILGITAVAFLGMIGGGLLLGGSRTTPPLASPAGASEWAELAGSGSGGGLSRTPGQSIEPSIAVDRAGNPVVAWDDESSGNFEIYLRQWNGKAWVELAGSAGGGGVSRTPATSGITSVAVDASGHPVVAWQELLGGSWETGNYEIYLRRFDGKAWVELGGSAGGGGVSANPGHSTLPTLQLDGSGNPIVAWSNQLGDGAWEIYVKSWNGNGWVELAGSASGGGISRGKKYASRPSLALDGRGRPLVAWESGAPGGGTSIQLRRFDGKDWGELGGSASGYGISGEGQTAGLPSLAVDAEDNPVVAWQDNRSGLDQIHLRRWDGGAWVELAGSATAGGLSRTATRVGKPSLKVDRGGNPVVAWEQVLANPEFSDIYLRAWNGKSWIGPEGSAAGGGLSDSPGGSNSCALVLDAEGNPIVAWRDFSSGQSEIYLKRFRRKPRN